MGLAAVVVSAFWAVAAVVAIGAGQSRRVCCCRRRGQWARGLPVPYRAPARFGASVIDSPRLRVSATRSPAREHRCLESPSQRRGEPLSHAPRSRAG